MNTHKLALTLSIAASATLSASTITLDGETFTGPIGFNNLSIIDQISQTVDGITSESLVIAGGHGLRLLFGATYDAGGGEIAMNLEHGNGMLIRNYTNVDLSSKFGDISLKSGDDIVLETYKSEPDNPDEELGKVIINADTQINGKLLLNDKELFTQGTNYTQIPTSLAISGRHNEFTNNAFGGYGLAVGGINKVAGSSIAVGFSNEINANGGSAAIGETNEVYGTGSFTVGRNNTVGDSSFRSAGGSQALGSSNNVLSLNSFVAGNANLIEKIAPNSTILGFSNNVRGASSQMVLGWTNESSASGTVTLGYGHNNNSNSATVVGHFSKSDENANAIDRAEDGHLFVIGNGERDNARSNALVVLRNGDIIIPKVQGDISMGIFGE